VHHLLLEEEAKEKLSACPLHLLEEKLKSSSSFSENADLSLAWNWRSGAFAGLGILAFFCFCSFEGEGVNGTLGATMFVQCA
jgi:hypothetical protein